MTWQRFDDNQKIFGKNFINRFIEEVDDGAKEKLKFKTQKEFFSQFGALIGNEEQYKDINYNTFKNLLDNLIKDSRLF